MLIHISQKQLVPISLTALLSCTAITSIATTGINPSIVLAKPVEYNIPISRQTQESYEQLMQRGENLAQSTINTRLKQNPSLDQIKVIIVGENEGAIAPLMSVQVSRQGWMNTPQVRYWATYFTDSRLLLGFDQAVATPTQPQPTAEKPPSPTPEGQQAPQPQQIPLLEDPPQERQRNPLPVPTQRLRNAGNEMPFVDPIDVQQLRPSLLK